SGAAPAEVVELTAGQGISVSAIPPNADADKVCIYVSEADGDTLRLALTLPAGTTSAIVTTGPRGRPLVTQFAEVMAPGDDVIYGHGLLWVMDGAFARWSLPGHYGLSHYNNYARFGAEIRLWQPLGEGGESAGIFASDHKRTYWLTGADPKGWRKQIVRGSPAVPGSACHPQPSGSVFGLEYSGPVAY